MSGPPPWRPGTDRRFQAGEGGHSSSWQPCPVARRACRGGAYRGVHEDARPRFFLGGPPRAPGRAAVGARLPRTGPARGPSARKDPVPMNAETVCQRTRTSALRGSCASTPSSPTASGGRWRIRTDGSWMREVRLHGRTWAARAGDPVRSEAGAGVEGQPQSRPAAFDAHPAQQHQPVRGRRHGQRVAALDHAVRGHPAADPDEGAVLVVAAPHPPPVHGLDREVAVATDEGGEDRVAVPARRAQPRPGCSRRNTTYDSASCAATCPRPSSTRCCWSARYG